MKLLILGSQICGNRGDSAILRGLLDAINILNPQAEVDVISRYPVSSSWLLNRPVVAIRCSLQMKQHNSAAGVVGGVKKVLVAAINTRYCSHASLTLGKLRILPSPRIYRLRAPAALRRHHSGCGIAFLSIVTACRSLNTGFAHLWLKCCL